MITPQQRAERRRHIGSSDSAAVLGVDPYRGPADVYVEKVFEAEDIPSNPAIELGNLFEKPLIEWSRRQLGVEIEEDVSLVHPGGILAANLDGLSRSGRCVVEAKVSSLYAEWGDEGTDEIPERVIVQATHQMGVCLALGIEVERAFVPALLSRFGRVSPQLFEVPFDAEVFAAILAEGSRFWADHVLPRVPPTNCGPPSLETVKRVIRTPKKTVSIPSDLAADLRAKKAAKKAAEVAEDEAKAALIAALGDADGGHDGTVLWTYLPQSRTTVDAQALKVQMPDVFRQFHKTTTFPALRESSRVK